MPGDTRWTQAAMRQVAEEERAALGLSALQRLDPYRLAAEHGIAVYRIDELAEDAAAARAVEHFATVGRASWSAALVPIGGARVIIDNTAHPRRRRRASIAHELGHHLLEHPFGEPLLAGAGCRAFDAARERQATFLAGELLVPWAAATHAAFRDRSDRWVADAYGVSEQFARMRLAGARVFARRALAKQSAAEAARSPVSA